MLKCVSCMRVKSPPSLSLSLRKWEYGKLNKGKRVKNFLGLMRKDHRPTTKKMEFCCVLADMRARAHTHTHTHWIKRFCFVFLYINFFFVAKDNYEHICRSNSVKSLHLFFFFFFIVFVFLIVCQLGKWEWCYWFFESPSVRPLN